MGQLEAFEVRYVDWEGSTLPDGQRVLWGIDEHTVDRALPLYSGIGFTSLSLPLLNISLHLFPARRGYGFSLS